MPTNYETRVALHNLCPHDTASGLPKIRLGPPRDCGYVVIDDFAQSNCLISLGVGWDVDFEYDSLQHGIKQVFMYDPTVDAPPRNHPSFVFHKKAMGITNDHNTITMSQLLKTHGLEYNTSLILKCDIEDAELGMIETTPEHVWDQFSQIVMEYHYLEQLVNPDRMARVSACWAKLSRTHNVVHVHGNTCGPLQLVNGISLPQCIEVTYLRKDRASMLPCFKTFPTPIDFSNDPLREDYFLGSFRFL